MIKKCLFYGYLLLEIFASSNLIDAFDWIEYVSKYPDLRVAGIDNHNKALKHYLNNGIKEGRSTTAITIPSSNFDWRYYVKKNNLFFSTEEDALKHYQQQGIFSNFTYCETFNIVILIHLDDLNQMDEIIDQINYFMLINCHNKYYIKINIPLAALDNFFKDPNREKR